MHSYDALPPCFGHLGGAAGSIVGGVSELSALASALIGAGAVLAGGILGVASNERLERRRERREAKRRRDAAVAELLTATVDLLTGAQAI